jgi:leucyl/phenylalanyl-tRNA--protein transferase
VETADENGILAFSYEIDVDYLLAAYTNGIFPWPVAEEHILWFAPQERAVLEFNELKTSKRFAQFQRNCDFEFKFNENFEEVIINCAKPRKKETGTWITSKIIDAYLEFHKAGFAVSFETYKNDKLVGGLYGVLIGKYFAGESMFHSESEASKFALTKTVDILKEKGLEWMDVQVLNPFLESLGCKEISRKEFMRKLNSSLPKIQYPV